MATDRQQCNWERALSIGSVSLLLQRPFVLHGNFQWSRKAGSSEPCAMDRGFANKEGDSQKSSVSSSDSWIWKDGRSPERCIGGVPREVPLPPVGLRAAGANTGCCRGHSGSCRRGWPEMAVPLHRLGPGGAMLGRRSAPGRCLCAPTPLLIADSLSLFPRPGVTLPFPFMGPFPPVLPNKAAPQLCLRNCWYHPTFADHRSALAGCCCPQPWGRLWAFGGQCLTLHGLAQTDQGLPFSLATCIVSTLMCNSSWFSWWEREEE